MKTSSTLAAAAALAITTGLFAAGSHLETFEGGSANEGAWSFGFVSGYPGSGGNPGSYLQVAGLDTAIPQLRTQSSSSAFTGDYRADGVSGVNVDLNTFSVDFGAGGRPCTLMLRHDPGTPGDPFDDSSAYFMGPNVPLAGEGWVSYNFDVPSQETTLPAGWQLINHGDSGAPAIHDWNTIIQDVTEVRFHYGDPTFFFIFQQWTLGADNIEILADTAPPCGDANGDGVVNVNDLNLIILNWGFCKGCATDFDGDNRTNVNDLVIVITSWGECE